MNAEKRRRAARWLVGDGIEIGALHNPLAVPPEANVRYVDRMRAADLRRHYPELADKELVPVSVIGDAHDLSAVADGSLDFVIANHLIEHLDNPIRGLEEMTRVLRPGGILYVALPEPRVSFDRFRQLTPVAHVVDEYRSGPAANREAHFRDWVHNVEAHVEGMPQLDEVAKAGRIAELMELDYSIHFHVWRPDTFLQFLVAATSETGINLEMMEFIPCLGGEDNEFIFIFAKGIAERPREVPLALDGDGEGVTELAMELERTRAALRAIERSRTWRYTEPLRALVRRARGLRRVG